MRPEKFPAAWFVLQECANSSFNEAAAEVWSPRARVASHPSAEALWKGFSCDAAGNPKPRTAEAVEFCWNIKEFSVFCFSSGSSDSLDVWTPQKWTSRNPPEWKTLIKPERYRWRRCWQSCVHRLSALVRWLFALFHFYSAFFAPQSVYGLQNDVRTHSPTHIPAPEAKQPTEEELQEQVRRARRMLAVLWQKLNTI